LGIEARSLIKGNMGLIAQQNMKLAFIFFGATPSVPEWGPEITRRVLSLGRPLGFC
jgi:hypothetical protein